MDNSLLSGFIGAILGSLIAGGFSLWGATKSTKTAIKAQKELMQEESNRLKEEFANKAKRYAHLIESEIIIWVEYSVRRINNVTRSNEKRAQNIDFNNNYRLYLDAFIEKLSIEESKLIIELYGLIKKININLENQSYVNGNLNQELLHSFELLVIKVYSKEFLEKYRMIDPSLITTDSLLCGLNKEYKLLLKKLISISQSKVYIE